MRSRPEPNGAALWGARSTTLPWRRLASASPRYDNRVRVGPKTVTTFSGERYSRETGWSLRRGGVSLTVVLLAYRKAGEPWQWTDARDFCAPEIPLGAVEAKAATYSPEGSGNA